MKNRMHRIFVLLGANLAALGLLVALHAVLFAAAPPAARQALAPVAVAEAGLSARRIISPDVLPAAHISDAFVVVRGWHACTAGATVELRVTLTQGATQSVGETTTTCTGHHQIWQVDVPITGFFLPGMADVHVWSRVVEEDAVFAWDDTVRLVGR